MKRWRSSPWWLPFRPSMNLTRVYTLVGLVLVLLSFVPLLMGKFWESMFLLGFVITAGIGVILWNLKR